MKYKFYFLAVFISSLLLLSGCKDDSPNPMVEVTVSIGNFDFDSTYVITSATLTMKEINSGTTFDTMMNNISLPYTLRMSVRKGFYDIDFLARVVVGDNKGYLSGVIRGISITETSIEQPITIEPILGKVQENFVLAEIFFAGTEDAVSGKQYTGDKYFVIVNNSDKTLYADGLAIMESQITNDDQRDMTPDWRDSLFLIQALYRIPGNGTDYPVEPGRCIILADNAIDHSAINANSHDLSKADFEWYDVSTVASVTDPDNPDIPNLDKIYCYSATIWRPSTQGNRSYAIGRIPTEMTVEQYISLYDSITYDYNIVVADDVYPMTGSAYGFPNSWIIDAVNLCPRTEYQWLTTSIDLDRGYTYIVDMRSDKSRFGKSLRRKIKSEDGGRLVLVDENNSSTDFQIVQKADPYFFRNR